jgi:hypothetical protein
MHPEYLLAQPAVCVNQHGGRSSLHRIGSHGAGKGVAVRTGQVDSDWESNAVFMKKRPKRCQPHGLMVLEHRMKSDDPDIRKKFCDTLSLWQTM